MPRADGKLTDADYKVVQAWMAKYRGGLHPCPICESTAWTIAENLLYPTTSEPDGLLNPTIVYPVVALLSPCGYFRYMSAVYLGLWPKKKA